MNQSFLSRLLQSRRMLKTLERLTVAQEEQTRLLARLVVHLCGPEAIPESPEDLKRHSGISFSRDAEQGQILDYQERFFRASGRAPTEEEVLDYLEGRPV